MKQNRQNRKQTQILKELENNPLIEAACRKVGIARSTYYRWGEADPRFKRKAEDAQYKGRAKMNDYAESKLFENIQQGQHVAITFWLSHNTARYRQSSERFNDSRMEKMKKQMWQHADIHNALLYSLGRERIAKLLQMDDYEALLKKIDEEYEQDQINRGYRGRYGPRTPAEDRAPYPDELDFG